MKKIFLLIPLLGMLWSCKKQDQQTPKQTETNTATGKLKSQSAKDGVWDLLGYGYDVTGEYANSSSTTFQVIDITKLYSTEPTRLVTNLNTTRNSSFSYGENVQAYASDISAHLNATVGFSLFKGSVTSAYSNSNSFNSKYIYGSYNLLIQQRELKFNATSALLQKYLTQNFLNDIATLTPQQIVSQYGAFVLSDIILGAKLQVTYQSETKSTDRKSAASAGLDASLGAIFSINAGVNSNHSQSSSNFNQYVHYLTNGGDPTLGITPATISFTQNTPPIDYSAWQASTNAQNAELINIAQSGLIPINELIPDPSLANAVKNYIYNDYLPNHQVQVQYGKSTLYRCFNTKSGDRMLVTDPNEVANQPNWNVEGSLGYVYNDNSKTGVAPLNRFLLSNGYHFFTTDVNEIPSQAKREGVPGYLDLSPVAGYKPLYRYRTSKNGSHMYSNDFNELGNGRDGWIYEGIIGYLQQ
ncbi:MAC/perforin domain-containing protein [Mucilaginibacter sp. RCC_168]|uniref:MAC/perforin domain-containing protein n=1 Tax=Mucilaginibacter sp. RCC_168 TaxID=3239221 RepID=UPI0035256495